MVTRLPPSRLSFVRSLFFRAAFACRQRRPGLCLGSVLAFALGHSPTLGGDLVPPDPWEVIHAVRKLGPAEVGRDAFRDPQITASLAGADGAGPALDYKVIFHGCDMGRKCTSVLFSMRLARAAWADRPPRQALADWNRTKLVGRAWLDARGRAVLDQAVVIGPGLPPDTLAATLSAWAQAMLEFAEHVDFTQE